MGAIVWAAAGFAAAVFGAEYLLPVSGLPYIAAALAAICLPALLLHGSRRRHALILAISAASGVLAWWARYELHVAPCEALAGQELTVTARVTGYPVETEDYIRLSVRLLDGAPRESAALYAFRDREALTELAPGDVFTARISVSSVMERSGDRTRTYTAEGKSLLGFVDGGAEITARRTTPWLYFPQTIGRSVKELCGRLFPDDTSAFMKGLLTGDKSDLYADTALYGSMRASGVLHVVAVSGMHIHILVAFLQLILGRSRRTSLICLPVMAAFVIMAGCGASVVRAAVMQTLLILAPVFERESDSAASLSAALLAILLGNPMAIGGVALQLSFTCVLGLVIFMPRLHVWMTKRLPMRWRIVRVTAQSVACTLCASVFSLPVAAYYFRTIPLLAVFANVLTLPVIEVLFSAGYVICAAGAAFPAAGAAAAWLLSWGVRWCALVYRTIAAIPFSCLYTVNAGAIAWLAFTYALLALWYLLRRRGVRIVLWIPMELCVIGLCAVLLTDGLSLRSGGGELTVLDVGQGECVVLTDETSVIVMDCGGSGRYNAGDAAADWLLSAGRARVDVLVLSHLHEDHVNGVETLLSRMPVGCIILPADADDEDAMLDGMAAAAQRQGTAVVRLREEHIVRTGAFTLSLYLPRAGSDANENGIVMLAETQDMSALVMGDAGTDAELVLLGEGLVPDVDILVAGHHGSKTASGALFLRAAQAETAVVSVGRNSYGLPADEVMARLEEYCLSVLRTDEDGTVTISMKEDEVIYYG